MKTITKNMIGISTLIAVQLTPVLANEDVTIDFVLSPRNHIIIPVSINKGPDKPFALDTAAGTTALNEKRLKGIVLDKSKFQKVTLRRAFSSSETFIAPLDSVSFAGLENRMIKAVLTDLTNVEKGVEKITGVLGYDFFGSFDLSINYKTKKLSFKKQIMGDKCHQVKGEPFKYIAGRLIKTTVTIAGKTMPAVLDTGASFSAINSAGANLLSPGATDQLTKMMDAHGRPENPDGGEYFVGPLQLPSITVGGSVLPQDDPFNVIDLPVFKYFDMVENPGLLVGGDMLKNRTVNISYGCKKLEII